MARLETLMSGIVLGESPRWHDGRLWFADWGRREVIARAADGTTEVVLRAGSFPLCFDWLPDGRMVAVSGREGKLLRVEADGTVAVHADLAALAATPWNDIAVDGRGHVFVDGTGFDFPAAPFAPGTIACVASDGSVRTVAGDLAFPNGMAVTADGTTLIVAESYGRRLTAFAIGADGTLGDRRVWAELGDGAPDGICVDQEGAVWYADVPNARCVRVREGGEVLETVTADRGCFACALGGEDGRTLFVVAADWSQMGQALAGGEPSGQLLACAVAVPGVRNSAGRISSASTPPSRPSAA